MTTCATCRFWRRLDGIVIPEPSIDNWPGHCHRRAPVLLQGRGPFPCMPAGGMCGEHRAVQFKAGDVVGFDDEVEQYRVVEVTRQQAAKAAAAAADSAAVSVREALAKLDAPDEGLVREHIAALRVQAEEADEARRGWTERAVLAENELETYRNDKHHELVKAQRDNLALLLEQATAGWRAGRDCSEEFLAKVKTALGGGR